jgi:ArsR family transcriptional regulator
MTEPLIPQDMFRQVARRFKLLGEPVRLEILNLLQVNNEMSVQQLVAATGQIQANVSKHLRVMAREGMVTCRKDGLYRYYRIDDPTLSALCLIVCGQLYKEKAESIG